MPGNTLRSRSLAYSSLHSTMPPRGPRSVLCVVVVTKSAHRHGIVVQPGRHQAGVMGHVDKQLRPDSRGDLGELADAESRADRRSAPATISFGLCSRASAATWSKSIRCVSRVTP